VADEPNPSAEADELVEPEPVPEPERRYGALVSWSRGQEVLHPGRDEVMDVLRAAHEDGFLVCIDVTGVDYLTFGEHASAEGSERPVTAASGLPVDQIRSRRSLPDSVEPERFEVVISLLRHADAARLRVRVQVPESDPTFPTLTDLWFGSDAMEREVFDMFGIDFTGHPDLTRILMPEDWVGYPLRKDYSSGRIPVQFKGDKAGTSGVPT
jgi:NADH:ubiquinone oxidoreductase subunit C